MGTLAGLLCCLAPCSIAQQDLRPNVPVPLEVRAISAPRALRQGAHGVIVYELVVANPVRSGYILERLMITTSEGEEVGRVEAAGWNAAAQRLPPRADEDRSAWTDGLELAGGERVLLYLWLELEADQEPPAELLHHLSVRTSGEDESFWSAAGPRLAVRTDVPVLDAPVRGGRWFVTNGFANDTDHRRFFMAHGEILIPQRFGADFLKLEEDGGNATNDGATLADFHSYDEPLYAVADGKVVSVVDHLEDNGPGADPGVLTWDEVAGNHVVLQIGPSTYALYAHIRMGALFVELGEEVERGQLIGAIGNSGNVSAPHLHFHVMDRPHPNSCNGVPFHFRSFEVLSEDYAFSADQRPLPSSGFSRSASIPDKHSVIRFPGED
jgi:murein DD-endopeptidase MepM/ murein hydrolase activator NlpD